jgi:hypothetical protein
MIQNSINCAWLMNLQTGVPLFEAWTDLVFHVLSHVQTLPEDHSSLYSKEYERWSRAYFISKSYASCEEAYTRLSVCYRSSPQSHLLHAFPALWDSISGFLKTKEIPFCSIPWTSEYRARIAEYIHENVTEELIQLFMESLRITADAGFENAWRRFMMSKEKLFVPQLLSDIQALCECIPDLQQAEWTISFPLRTHGRMIAYRAVTPRIFVGVPNAIWGVQASHPLMQGCHEFLVWREQMAGPASDPEVTVAGMKGYGAFLHAELRALAAGERILAHGQWREAYHKWRSTFRGVM